MDIFYEQNVVNNHIDSRAKKTRTLVIAKSICLTLGVFCLVSTGMLGNAFFRYFWILVLISAPFFVFTVIFEKINRRNNAEYDYYVDNEYISICEIYYRESRKQRYKIMLRQIAAVGMFDSDGYKKISKTAVKKNLALVNYDDEKSILYILYCTEKGRQLIFIEPDCGFIIALRRALSSSALTIFDSSVNLLERRLTEKEQAQTAQFKSDAEITGSGEC